MQSVFVYGRIVARAVFSGITNDIQHQGPWSGSHNGSGRDLHLVTAASGLSKTQSPVQLRKKWSFGDDACFVANNKASDVIGK